MKKVLYFDCETTGTNPLEHEIIQFAALIEIDGKVVDTLSLKARPERPVDPAAMAIHGLEGLDNEMSQADLKGRIQLFLDKHIDKYDKADKFFPCGHNVYFDLQFLNELFTRHGAQYGTGVYQNWQMLDTRYMANLLIFNDKLDVENVKLETLCKYYGITIKAHDAMSDIQATRKLFLLLSNTGKPVKEKSAPVAQGIPLLKITGTSYHDMLSIQDELVLKNGVQILRDPSKDMTDEKTGVLEPSYKIVCKGKCIGYVPRLSTLRKYASEKKMKGDMAGYRLRVEEGLAVKLFRTQFQIDSDSNGTEQWAGRVCGLLYATDEGWNSSPIKTVEFQEYSDLAQKGMAGDYKLKQVAISVNGVEAF